MRRKKFGLFAVIIAVMVASLAVFATACGDKETFSETYTGAVSEESYDSADAALHAFVETELSGDASTAVFVSYEKESVLSEAEVTALALPESATKGLISVEKGKVNYKETLASPYSLAAYAASDDTLTLWKGVYVLNYGSTFRYYTPQLSTGETLTRSYFESVFNPENYKNVTMSMNMAMDMKMTFQGEPITVKSNSSYSFKITETAVALDFTVTGSGFGQSQNIRMSVYLVETDDDIICAVKENNQWQACSIYDLDIQLEIDSIEDIYTSGIGDLDQSYFVKTASGFKVDDKKMDEYLAAAMGSLDGLFGEIGAEGDGYDVKADANYYVKEGKLSKADMAFSMNMLLSGVSAVISTSVNCNYSNYGTTTVTLPAEVKAVLGI